MELNDTLTKVIDALQHEHDNSLKNINKSLYEANKRELTLQTILSKALAHLKFLVPYINVCVPEALAQMARHLDDVYNQSYN